MSILNLGVLNSIKNGVNSLISGVGKGTNSQTLTLEPGVQTVTNIFDVSDVNAIIAIRLTAVTLGDVECGVRYHDESGGISFVEEEPFNFSAQSIYEQREIQLKASRVSFRLTNNGAVNKTLTLTLSKSASTLYTREKQMQSLFSRDSVVLEPGDTTVYSDILEINGDYGVIGMRGAAGTPSTPIEISPRYHGQGSNIISTGDPVFINVASLYTGNVAAVFPMIHKRVSFRIVNRGDTAITINNAVISPRDTDPTRDTDPNGSSLNIPLSPDGAMYVQLKDEVDSAAYDAFYGSLKTLRTYKPDFRIVVAPPTPKTTDTDESFEYSLQDGADHVRIYLKVTVTGDPFPDENDGVSLNIFYKDATFETLAMTGNKIKTGSSVYLLGKTLNEIQSVDALFGDDIKVILKTTGTIDASNNFTYEIVSYQKFK